MSLMGTAPPPHLLSKICSTLSIQVHVSLLKCHQNPLCLESLPRRPTHMTLCLPHPHLALTSGRSGQSLWGERAASEQDRDVGKELLTAMETALMTAPR